MFSPCALLLLLLGVCLWDAYILPCAVLPVLCLFCGRRGGYSAAFDEDEDDNDKGAQDARERRRVDTMRTVVLVTGAARQEGIGYHIARGFLDHGCNVILFDINAEALRHAERALDPSGQLTQWRKRFGDIDSCDSCDINDQFLMSVVCDVSDPEAVRKAKMQIQSAAPISSRIHLQRQNYLQRKKAGTNPQIVSFEPRIVDILVQNAGVVTGKSLCELSPDETHRTLSVNLSSHFYGLRMFLPAMIAHDRGFIVTVASMMGHIGGAHLAPYCAAKWGLLGLDECLRMELRRSGTTGVRTMAVCPYVVSTGMFSGAFIDSDGNRSNKCSANNTWLRRLVHLVRENLIPALTAESVASDIVYETITRHKSSSWHARCSCGARGSVLVLPRRMALAPALVRFLPIGVQEWILDLLGGVHGMDGFHGHRHYDDCKKEM